MSLDPVMMKELVDGIRKVEKALAGITKTVLPEEAEIRSWAFHSVVSDIDLKKGDVMEIERIGNKIIMLPKEVIFEDKYPQEDLEATEKVLSKGLPKEEITFKTGETMMKYFKKRIKK